MANDLPDKIPDWLKSLYNMENNLRGSARNGLIPRKDKALNHLTEARRHFEEALNQGRRAAGRTEDAAAQGRRSLGSI